VLDFGMIAVSQKNGRLNISKENIFGDSLNQIRTFAQKQMEVMLKLGRKDNDDNEKNQSENIMQLCSKNNKT
jgi:hypothetical protein